MGTRSPIQDPHSLQVWRNSICPPCISSHIVLTKKTPAGRDCSELMSKQIVGRMKAQWFGYSPLCGPPARDYPMSRQRITPFTRYHRYTPPPPYPPILCAATSSGLFSWRYIRAELQTSTHRAPISRAEQHNTSNQPSIQPWYHLASAIWVVAKTAPLSFFPFHPACSIQHCIIWIFGILIGWQK